MTAPTDPHTQAWVAAALIRELEPRFADTLILDQMCLGVRQAIADLRGSLCVESLREMAARLAHHRPQEQVHADQDTTTLVASKMSERD